MATKYYCDLCSLEIKGTRRMLLIGERENFKVDAEGIAEEKETCELCDKALRDLMKPNTWNRFLRDDKYRTYD